MGLSSLPTRPRRTTQGSKRNGRIPLGRIDSGLRALNRPPPRPLWLALMLAVIGALVVAAWLALGQVAKGVEPRAFEQHRSDSGTEGLGGSLVAQSFRSPRDNLSRVDFELSFIGPRLPDGAFKLVEGDGTGGRTLHTAPLDSSKVVNNVYLSYSFPPIAASGGQTYTVVLDAPNRELGEAVGLRYNSFDTLSSGQLYTQGGSQAGDLAFTARYSYGALSIVGDVVTALTSDLWLVIAWLAALVLPGLTLLTWLPNRLQGGQRLLASVGVSALLWPVLFLLTRAVGVGVNGFALWVLLMVCVSLLLARPVLDGKRPRPPRLSREDWAFWSLVAAIFGLTLDSRLLALRDASAGMGLDAYHHTLISQMFLDQGGVPSDYQPYAPLTSFTYHYGFHALTAVVAWLSGRDTPDGLAVLMPQVGQVGTALPVLTLTLFGWRALGNRWAGLAAGALAGLVSVFPAFYVNWSRYTQGWGLALLPIAWVLLLECLQWRERPGEGVKGGGGGGRMASWDLAVSRSAPYMLAVVGVVGLTLTHYRIVIIYALFALLYLAWRLLAGLRARQALGEAVQPLWRGLVVLALSVAALLPWLINLRQNFTTNFVNRPSDTSLYYNLERTVGSDLLNHFGLALMVPLSLGGVGWALKRRDPMPLLPATAWLILLAWSNPYLWAVRLPFSGYLDVTTLVSSAWFPVSILAGYTVAEFGRWVLSLGKGLGRGWGGRWRVAAFGLISAVIVLAGLASAFHLGSLLDNKPYIAPGDMAAMRWMRANVSPDSYVLANPFGFEWDAGPNQSVHGSDAGLWIPLLAAKGTDISVPPLPAYNERRANPRYIDELREIIAYEPFEGRPADWEALKRNGATHLYIGSRGGAFNARGLLQSDNVELVFHQDSAWVFRIR